MHLKVNQDCLLKGLMMSLQYEILYAISQEIQTVRASYYACCRSSVNIGSENMFMQYERELVNSENNLRNAMSTGVSPFPEEPLMRMTIRELKKTRTENDYYCRQSLSDGDLINAVKHAILHLQIEKILNLRCHVCSCQKITS